MEGIILSFGQHLIFYGSALLLFGLGLLVYKKNPKSIVNRVFLGFTVATLFALTFNYFADAYLDYSVLWNRLTFTFGILMILTLVYLALLFPKPKPIKGLIHFLIVAPISALALIATFTDLIVADIKLAEWGTDVIPGDLFTAFTPIVVVYSIWALVVLWNKFRRSTGREKQQLLYVTLGLLFFLLAGIYTQLISFYIIGDYRMAKYGPYAAYFFSFFTTYAIIAHRLFDIRVIIKRTVIFAGISAFVLTAYSAVSFLVSGVLGVGGEAALSPSTLIPGLFGALLIAVGFNPIYRWLSQVTDRWLFKGEYKQDEVLKDLSDTLANVIDLDEAIQGMMQVVVREMRLEKAAVFMLHPPQQGAEKKEGYELKAVVKVGTFPVKDLLLSPKDSLVSFFEHRGIENDDAVLIDDLKRSLEVNLATSRKNETSALASRLAGLGATLAMPLVINRQENVKSKPGEPTKTREVKTLIGILLLGAKKSGDVYSDQDLNLLDIVAAETAAAVEKSRFFEEDRLKSEFVSIASHELLTPTTAMKGYLSMVLDEGIGKVDNKARVQLEKVYKESNRLAKLVKDLLNVSRIERNKIIIESKPLDVVELVAQAVDGLKFKAKERNLKLEFTKPKTTYTVSADEEKLLEVFINLIGNSLKYTKEGKVWVEINKEDGKVAVAVADTGIGISAKDLQHLFTKFYRASNVDETGQSGTGLGLYVSKHVTELMGGTIEVDSKVGKGSTFTVRLPLSSKTK